MQKMKFRARDKEKNKWIIIGFHIIGEVTVFDMLKTYSIEDSNNIEVTQFTGILDKTNEEIYQGDIVYTSQERFVKYWEVVFERGKFFLKNKHSTRELEGPEEKFILIDHCLIPDIEVVGNVYENADLLEAKE